MPRKKKEPERRQIAYPGVFPYPTKGGTRYRYQFDVPPGPDGKRRVKTKRGFLTEQAADRAMQEEKARLYQTGYVLEDDTLDQYFERWMRFTQQGRRAQTNRNYRYAWGRLPDAFRAITLSRLTPSQIRAVYAEIVGRYAAGTCKFSRAVLMMVLAAAHRDRLIATNPAAGIRLPVNRDTEQAVKIDPDNVWSKDEVNAFLAATLDHPDHMLWRLLVDSGLRIGEALALNWDDVDLAQRTVTVRRTVTSDAQGHGIIGAQPKTQASRRVVKLMPETVEYLRRYQTAQKARRLQCGPLWQDRGLVFDAGDGTLMTRPAAHFRFTGTILRLGFRPLTLHGLRHTMAVTWLRAGKSPKAVSDRLGHASAAFTLDVYARVSLDWQQSDADDVEAFMKRTG